jgi:hypothetical protein
MASQDSVLGSMDFSIISEVSDFESESQLHIIPRQINAISETSLGTYDSQDYYEDISIPDTKRGGRNDDTEIQETRKKIDRRNDSEDIIEISESKKKGERIRNKRNNSPRTRAVVGNQREESDSSENLNTKIKSKTKIRNEISNESNISKDGVDVRNRDKNMRSDISISNSNLKEESEGYMQVNDKSIDIENNTSQNLAVIQREQPKDNFQSQFKSDSKISGKRRSNADDDTPEYQHKSKSRDSTSPRTRAVVGNQREESDSSDNVTTKHKSKTKTKTRKEISNENEIKPPSNISKDGFDGRNRDKNRRPDISISNENLKEENDGYIPANDKSSYVQSKINNQETSTSYSPRPPKPKRAGLKNQDVLSGEIGEEIKNSHGVRNKDDDDDSTYDPAKLGNDSNLSIGQLNNSGRTESNLTEDEIIRDGEKTRIHVVRYEPAPPSMEDIKRARQHKRRGLSESSSKHTVIFLFKSGNQTKKR